MFNRVILIMIVINIFTCACHIYTEYESIGWGNGFITALCGWIVAAMQTLKIDLIKK